MASSKEIAVCSLLMFAVVSTAQAQSSLMTRAVVTAPPVISLAAKTMLEGLPPAMQADAFATARDLSHRASTGLPGIDTPLARACSFILGDASRLYDENRVMDTAFHSLRFREWMCRSNFRTNTELADTGAALDVANPGFASMFGFFLKDDPASFARQMGQFCSAGYELHVNDAARENFQRQARATMTDAYKTCLDTSVGTAIGKSGLFAYATPLGKDLRTFTIGVRWLPDTGDKPITSIEVSNARCKAEGRLSGKALRSVGGRLSLACERTNDRTGGVTLRTSSGSETLMLPSQTDAVLVRLEDRLAILKDRIALIEQGLDKVAPQTIDDLREDARQ
jgi:hypothetical protein